MKIGIIVAMDKEFAQLCKLLSHPTTEQKNKKTFVTGTLGKHEIVLQQCGIGKVNSTIGAVEMIDLYAPELVISTGVAGGADPTLNVQDVVVGTEYVYHDAYCGEGCAYGQLQGMPARYEWAPFVADVVDKIAKDCAQEGTATLRKGLIVSGDWFVDSREKMSQIMNHFPTATAVDMESCSIAQTCHVYGVPFVSIRVISDVPLRDNKASQYFDFWDRLANESFGITRSLLENIQ